MEKQRVIMMCGKICSGKTTYAQRLRVERGAALLSVDEITLALFGLYVGEKHDEYVEKTERYLYNKSLEILEIGKDVILDWGFWTRDERRYAREFYRSRGFNCELHYIDIDDDVWHERLEKRNREVEAGRLLAYPVDENLAAKFASIFEAPEKAEIDVLVGAGGETA